MNLDILNMTLENFIKNDLMLQNGKINQFKFY